MVLYLLGERKIGPFRKAIGELVMPLTGRFNQSMFCVNLDDKIFTNTSTFFCY